MNAEPYRVYLRGELGKLGPQERITPLVDALADSDAVLVANLLSACRGNSVASSLGGAIGWEQRTVPVEEIRLGLAEGHLATAFNRHGRRLMAVARDDEVLSDPAYRDHRPGEQVFYPVLLARPDGPEEFVVIDGMHRAIQLAHNGVAALDLCVLHYLPLYPLSRK